MSDYLLETAHSRTDRKSYATQKSNGFRELLIVSLVFTEILASPVRNKET